MTRPTISRVGPQVVMLEKRKRSRDAGTDRRIQLANGFVIPAEKELLAFISAVDKLFGPEQAHRSALDWIEELELMDWPSGESVPDWRRATLGASARLGTLMCSGDPTLGNRGRRLV
jgi:hypothetical protein